MTSDSDTTMQELENQNNQQPEEKSARHGPMRRLYNWVLSWADTPYGTPALAVIAFTESSFFPIPPDVLQMALSVSKPKRSFYYATISSIFSVLGAILGWYIGYALWQSVGPFFETYIVSQDKIDKVIGLYQANAFLAILGAAFTPIPYKVFTIAAGMCNVSIWTLLLASAIGRSARFYIVATIIYIFGPGVKDLIDRYFNLISLALFALLIGGFVIIRYVL